jgi:multiple sugar transport system permease protein
MGMISLVGRRRTSVRFTLWAITLALILGSVTMLYPMLLMLSGSTKSNADSSDNRLIPAFIYERNALWKKHVESLFNESLQLMRSCYESDAPSFDALEPPSEPNRAFAAEWLDFLEQANLPPTYYTIGHLQSPLTAGVLPQSLREIRRDLNARFAGDLSRLNDAMGTNFFDWNAFILQPPQYLRRSQLPGRLPIDIVLEQYVQRQPIASRVYFSIEGFYREQFLRQQFPTIDAFNAHHATHYASLREVHLAREYPDRFTSAERESWEQFVRTTLNLRWIRATSDATDLYRSYLRAKYLDISALNHAYHTSYPSFEQIPLIVDPPIEGLAYSDWDSFVQGWTDPATGTVHQLPVKSIRIHCIDFLFQDHLRQKHQSIEACNRAMGTHFQDFNEVSPPQRDVHWMDFDARRGSIRWEFLKRNYITVADYMALHGRAVWNTVIYCALAIAGALIVNPLAAYALSRYKPSSTYQLLLIMMLTMAFPPMVTQIPVFLLMRDLGMLNTYWALILPGLANGYSIFMLKGFFDSLPQELYESATLDGAGEIRIFWQITMSLSKPILAVVALSAFTSAYSNFMFALLICQDQNMWTLMVWLYQLQARSSEGVILASLTLAALPTLVVFVLCQRVIMRGIVVPVEK